MCLAEIYHHGPCTTLSYPCVLLLLLLILLLPPPPPCRSFNCRHCFEFFLFSRIHWFMKWSIPHAFPPGNWHYFLGDEYLPDLAVANGTIGKNQEQDNLDRPVNKSACGIKCKSHKQIT
ncbi:uncharacterized protein A4U43_C03F1500 [Asparagus officinalis]|uniref:Secreted protein n=1 Tax=Asparagus officinalis TaxID=4686 RepID=A0A5P1F770_ASPOF|nr:uncharacterized protein A4U43_C03F1500 [Asparagus officinalis]